MTGLLLLMSFSVSVAESHHSFILCCSGSNIFLGVFYLSIWIWKVSQSTVMYLINLSLYRTLCDTLPRAVCQRGCNLFIDVQFTLVILAIELMKNSV